MDARWNDQAHVARAMRTDHRVSGLRWLGVEHEGIRTSSTEESEAVARVFNTLVGREWTYHE